MSRGHVLDLAPGTDVAAPCESCALCCAMVFTNQPHIRNEKGVFHAACQVDQGRCHVCKRKVLSTELYKKDGHRLYHAKCTAKFKNVCYLCNDNIYDIPSRLCKYVGGRGWHHEDCMKNNRDTCCVCGFEVRYKPFGKRLVFRRPDGDLVHTACDLIPIVIDDLQDEKPPDAAQSCTQHYNAQPPLSQASCGIMVVWSGPSDQCCKGFCQICKVMVYRSQQRFVDENGLYFHDSCYQGSSVARGSSVAKGICQICKVVVHSSQQRFRDPKGLYFHDSCYRTSPMGIKAVIAKKPITSAKLHTKKSSSGVQSGSGDNAH